MRHVRELRPHDQMTLFHPPPRIPRWLDFPVEIREQTVRLLARFLRQHHRARLAEGEVWHE